MASRPVLFLIGAATAASFAAGWWAGLIAKPHPITVAHSAITAAPAAASPVAFVADPQAAATAKPAEDPVYTQKVLPFMRKYCLECHNDEKASGGFSLEGSKTQALARKNRKDWEAAKEAIAEGVMPPKKKLQPTKDERAFIVDWIENSLVKVDCTGPKDPGRVTIRRLNRAEYNNTIRDLCGVDFKPAESFPADDVGYGFDNIGDVLSFQPILLEKYLDAAERILDAALTVPPLPASTKQTYRAFHLTTVPASAKLPPIERARIVFRSEGNAVPGKKYNFAAEGEYMIRFHGWGTNDGGEFPKVVIRVGGRDLKSFTVDAPEKKPGNYEIREKLSAGEARVEVAFVNGFEDKATKTARQFGITLLEIEGPFNPVPKPEPDSAKLLLPVRPKGQADARTAAETVLTRFARRAYRRPAQPNEVKRLLALYDLAAKQGEPFEKAIRLPMKAVLVSPHFLYRIEDDPANQNDIRTLNDFEFATRLSYFLWSSMPDDELSRHAETGDLRQPAVLEAQVKRMLRDPKSRALSENFAGQWLQLRNMHTVSPDRTFFPNWNEQLRTAMIGEAETFFEYVVREDRSILEFLDADYTFVNDRLAKHYGLPNVTGAEFRKVKLPDTRRGGIITMASTLTVTSNPTRTSPVKRGKWILENILNTPPPPPAPDVPELPPTGELKGTLRQQMEQHRANPVCANCHAKLDPLGFGLENFDGIGAWRTADNKKPIDASGVLPDGAAFNGSAEMRKILLGKADQFRRCFAEKLLTFALGRGLEYYDVCAVNDVVTAGKTGDEKFSAYVLAVVKSDPFQKRKGKRSE